MGGRAGGVGRRCARHPGGTPIIGDSDGAHLVTAEQVFGGNGLRALTERLDGVYAVARLGPDGAGVLVNDPSGLQPLYYARRGDTCIVSTRIPVCAALVQAITGSRPGVDEDEALWVVLNGQFFGEATGYRDIRLVPFGTAVEIDERGGIRFVPWHQTPTQASAEPSRLAQDWLDRDEFRMMGVIGAAIALEPGRVSCELTGGRDSRMNLDLAVRAGVLHELSYHSFGAPASAIVRRRRPSLRNCSSSIGVGCGLSRAAATPSTPSSTMSGTRPVRATAGRPASRC